MDWFSPLKKLIFIKGSQQQRQFILNEIQAINTSFLDEYKIITGDFKDLNYRLKQQENSAEIVDNNNNIQPISNKEGLLKNKEIEKLQSLRPCLFMMLYKESEVELMKKDIQEVKEIQKYKSIKALYIIQMNNQEDILLNGQVQISNNNVNQSERNLTDWWLKKGSEVESKYLFTYTDNGINIKKIVKSIEENSNYYYKELIKKKKKKINKQNTETMGTEQNLRIMLQLLLIYESMKNYKKNMKIETDIIGSINQLNIHYNSQIQPHLITNPDENVSKYLVWIQRIKELRQINDMVFLRRLMIIMKEESSQVYVKVNEYYKKYKEKVDEKVELLNYDEYRWRYLLFSRVVMLLGDHVIAEKFKKYVIYYFQIYSNKLNNLLSSPIYSALNQQDKVQANLKDNPRFYGRNDYTVFFNDNNILQQTQQNLIAINKIKLYLLIQYYHQTLPFIPAFNNHQNSLIINYQIFLISINNHTHFKYDLQYNESQFWIIFNIFFKQSFKSLAIHLINSFIQYLNNLAYNQQIHLNVLKIQLYLFLLDSSLILTQLSTLYTNYQQHLQNQPNKLDIQLKIPQDKIFVEIIFSKYYYKQQENLEFKIQINNQQMFNQIIVQYNIDEYDEIYDIDTENNGTIQIKKELSSEKLNELFIKEIILKNKEGIELVLDAKNIKYKNKNKILIQEKEELKISMQVLSELVKNEIGNVTINSNINNLKLQSNSNDMEIIQKENELEKDEQGNYLIKYQIKFNSVGLFELKVVRDDIVVLIKKIKVLTNFILNVKKNKIEIESSKVDAVIKKITINGKEILKDTILKINQQEMQSLFLREIENIEQVEIVWVRTGEELEQKSELLVQQLIQQQEQQQVIVEYQYEPICSIEDIIKLSINIQNTLDTEQMFKIELKQMDNFLVHGHLVQQKKLIPLQSFDIVYLLIPKIIGQQLLPILNIYNFNKADNKYHIFKSSNTKYIFIKP